MDFVCSERTVVSTGTTLSGMPSLSANKAELLILLFWLDFSWRWCCCLLAPLPSYQTHIPKVFAEGEGGKWGFELDAAAFRFSNTPVTAQRVELPYRCA